MSLSHCMFGGKLKLNCNDKIFFPLYFYLSLFCYNKVFFTPITSLHEICTNGNPFFTLYLK